MWYVNTNHKKGETRKFIFGGNTKQKKLLSQKVMNKKKGPSIYRKEFGPF